MKVEMCKFRFLCSALTYELFLEQLRTAGVVHVKQLQVADDARLHDLLTDLDKISSLLVSFPRYGSGGVEKRSDKNLPDLIHDFSMLQSAEQQAQAAVANLEKRLKDFSVWGDYSETVLQALKNEGCKLFFFKCSPKDESHLKSSVVVGRDKSAIYVVAVGEVDIDYLNQTAESVVLDLPVSQLKEQHATAVEHLKSVRAELKAFVGYYTDHLLDLQKRCLRDTDLQRVRLSGNAIANNRVILLEGYCPKDKTEELQASLRDKQVFFQLVELDTDEQAPILLRNNSFARLFEPITKLYSLPNYQELDPTPFFAPFFVLFFGLCLGDGGYGLLLLLAGCALLMKVSLLKRVSVKDLSVKESSYNESLRSWSYLAIYLGVCTLLVGVSTGVFFGIDLQSVSFFTPIKHIFLTDANYKELLGGYSPMMVFAVGVGVFQILFAMLVKVIGVVRYRGWRYAVYDMSWLVLLLTAIVYVAMPDNIHIGVKYGLYSVLAVCMCGILFYSDPDRRYKVLNIGSGLWGIYNMLSGLLGDVLSYIRLFALGLAGGILGSVFNSLAGQVFAAMPSYIGWLPCVLILLFGHCLNFGLSFISAVVHPLRLTFVEYYKNSGFVGGGSEYKPFKE